MQKNPGKVLINPEADETMHSPSQFLIEVSHELRTSLNSILGFANVLLKNKDGNLSMQDISCISRIVTNSTHMLNLLNTMLCYAKVEASHEPILLVPISLPTFVQDIVDMLEGYKHEKDVTVTVDIPQNIKLLETDPERLKIILLNLVSNAIKYGASGTVTIKILTNPETSQAKRIEITDQGIGIEKDQIPQIFQPFHRLEKSSQGGSGLGLSIAKALCDHLGYLIEVQSEVGKGSTFSIIIS